MLSFIHAADIHLDSPLKGLERYEGAPVEEIRQASRRALINLVDYAIDEEIPLIVLAGDVYDGDWKDFQTGLFFSRQMTRLRQHGIRVVLISGNHDAANKMTGRLKLPENVTTLSPKRPQTVTFDDIKVAVHGQGFAAPMEKNNLACAYPEALPGMINIGLLHTAIFGVDGHANYAPCNIDDLVAKGYDYWALGHVHDYKVLCETPPILYSGIIQGRHIRETGPKGCIRVDIAPGETARHTFLPLDVMRWAFVEVDTAGAATQDEILDRFREAMTPEIAAAEDRPLAMRVVLTGACAAHADLVADPEQALNLIREAATDHSGGRAWVEKVKDLTTTPIDLDALRESNTPQGDLLRYLDQLESGEADFGDLDFDLTALKAKLSRTNISLPDMTDAEERAALLRDVRELILPSISSPTQDA